MTEDESIIWLRELDDDLWPSGRKWNRIALQATRTLTPVEQDRVARCIEEHRLVTEMFSSNMFGGIGMTVYDNPAAPGVPLVPVLRLIEDHIAFEKHARLDDKQACRDTAWEFFSRFTHAEQNQRWLKHLKMKHSRDRSHYAY